jgi:hypothetical protein
LPQRRIQGIIQPVMSTKFHSLLIAFVALTGLLISGCSKPEEAAPESAPSGEATSTDVSAAKAYPLDVCIVSDEELGSMGDPVVFVHNGQQIKVCCDDCKPAFEKDPAKYLAKLNP